MDQNSEVNHQEDLVTMCRGCLATQGEMKSMYEWGLIDEFFKFTNVQVTRSQGLSELLCGQCEAALLECRRFRVQCQRADVTLQDLDRKSAAVKITKSDSAKNADYDKNTLVSADESKDGKGVVHFQFTEHKLILQITPSELDSKHDGNLVCPYECNNVFAKKNHLLKHLVKCHNVVESSFVVETLYYCPYENCAFHFNSAKAKHFTQRKFLKQHMDKVHRTKAFACEKCCERYSTDTALKRHLESCEVRYFCELCSIEYKNNETLLVHLMRKHPDVHKQYKMQKKLERERLKRLADSGNLEVKRMKVNVEVSSTIPLEQPIVESANLSEYLLDKSPKRTFATQTVDDDKCVKNDISLGVWDSPVTPKSNQDFLVSPRYGRAKETSDASSRSKEFDHMYSPCDAERNQNFSTIETQTVFEDLLSLRSQNSEDDSLFFSENVSLADIQTQTWPVEFGLSETQTQLRRTNRNTSETQTRPLIGLQSEFNALSSSPDLHIKETQTCFCLLDSPKPSSHFNFPKSLFDSVTSSPANTLTSTETQTAENSQGYSQPSSRTSDVLLSFSSAETQTCFEDSVKDRSL